MPSASSLVRGIAKWCLLIACVSVALLLLNSALFSAWMSGGPPNPHPQGWARRSEALVLFALAAFVAGVALFPVVARFPSIGRISWGLVLVAAALASAPFVARFVLIDSCLDQGGRWNHATLECER
jgi:hypothetical protein